MSLVRKGSLNEVTDKSTGGESDKRYIKCNLKSLTCSSTVQQTLLAKNEDTNKVNKNLNSFNAKWTFTFAFWLSTHKSLSRSFCMCNEWKVFNLNSPKAISHRKSPNEDIKTISTQLLLLFIALDIYRVSFNPKRCTTEIINIKWCDDTRICFGISN